MLLDERRERAFVGEIKWSRKPISPGLMANLKRRARACHALRNMRCTYALISRSGFNPPPKRPCGERYIDLSALG